MPDNPLAEVFGFSCQDQSDKAQRYRKERLCPYNNLSPNCTKDKANAPLGVCSIYHNGAPAITCPVRFREDWLVAEKAANFFFGTDATWTSIPEVRLRDANGKSAGNIDLVIVKYDDGTGKLLDYGALEIQAVYISGNVREPFEEFMGLTIEQKPHFDWGGRAKYPRADFLSSSRKRLVPQLLFKGKILHSWERKCAVALDKPFFNTLPNMDEVEESDAEVAWMVYDLVPTVGLHLALSHVRTVYTKFNESLLAISTPDVGQETTFVQSLQAKIDEKLNGNAPTAPLLGEEEED